MPNRPNMSELELILTGKTERHIHWLTQNVGIHHEMLSAFEQLTLAAKAAGFELCIASGFRSFDRQLAIWNNKFSGITAIKDKANQTLAIEKLSEREKIHAIMLFSALPGASRHHWGCDIDVYAKNLLPQDQALALEPWEYQSSGYFYPLSVWLQEHAKSFGFFLPYDKFRGGVAQEPWHLSYLPLSKEYKKFYSEKLLAETLLSTDIQGKNELLHLLPELYQRYIINTAEA
ncbi:MAG: LAS superfamily LD-carboxypeptidase LdcB [Colwellia sp.]|jgi:LAS superfamily LD-carboxypeptidase LdcB|tara:strand:- start:5463 stop:6158 length:696 start_codon:yes stop_codon:yes gene_type:complete